ncbi:MAG: FliA/WhiG family RNA polymerase sigma factor [Candidatus Hydrogenedentota bacterium]
MTEKDLWLQWKQDGELDARDALAVQYMHIVKYVAGRMAINTPPGIDYDDLVSWGVLGLLDALDKFDPGQQIRCSTYAGIRVRGAILDQIRALDWAPRSLRAIARKVNTAREKLRQANSREPSSAEIAAHLDLTQEQVERTLAQLYAAQMVSLDAYLPSTSDEEGQPRQTQVGATEIGPDAAAERSERQEHLADAIRKLPEQQQKVLNLYYYEELTLKEIGAVLNVSESRICQVHGAAVNNLRRVMHGDE